MKIFLTLIICIIYSITGRTQTMDSSRLDLLLSIPQEIELKISTPQPRIKEKMELSLNINYVRAQIFKTELGKFDLADDIGETDRDFMIMKVNALQKGKQFIGPLSFTMNGTKYSTNKVEYEVIDALPKVDKGVWIRKVLPNDSTVCIIVEQRIPAISRVTKIAENTTKYWTESETNNIITMTNTPSIKGLQYNTSSNFAEEGFFYNSKNEQKKFLSGYSINYFKIIDKKLKIKITKSDFLNLPTDYKFEDIIIQ